MDPRKLVHISDLPNNLNFLSAEIKHLLPIHYQQFIHNLLVILQKQAFNLNWPIYNDTSLTLSTAASSHYSEISGGWFQNSEKNTHKLQFALQIASIILNYINYLLNILSEKKNSYKGPEAIQRVDHMMQPEHVSSQRLQIKLPAFYAYNIHKIKDKEQKTRFIFLIARHNQPEIQSLLLVSAIRTWNIERLKTQHQLGGIEWFRCHKYIEHLITITREMMVLEQEDSQSQKKQINNILSQINIQKTYEQLPRQGISKQNQVILSRFEMNYKVATSKKQMTSFCAQSYIEILKMMPVNFGCSYAGRIIHEPTLNQIILIWITTYKISTRKRIMLLDNARLDGALKKGAQFLRKKSIEQIKENINIADQILKSSLSVLNKYQNSGYKSSNINEDISSNKKIINSQSQSLISEKIDNFDRISRISKISFNEKGIKSNVKDSKEAKEIAQNIQYLNSPLSVYRQNQYSQLIKYIQQWQFLYGKILVPSEIQNYIRLSCESSRLKYSNKKINAGEEELLRGLSALKYYLQVDQMVLLLKNYQTHKQCIFQIIFQQSNAKYLLQIGIKLAKEFSISIYQLYLKKQFKIDKNHIFVYFLKRYALLCSTSDKLPQIHHKIQMSLMISILQTKDYSSSLYKKLLYPLLQDIFVQIQQLKIISPILVHIYQILLQDHHLELINSLIATICFEVVYFSFDMPIINNLPYKGQKNLKEKKLIQMIREGGFHDFGYQLNSILKPFVYKNQSYICPFGIIYDEILINRPLLVLQFINLIIQSHFTQHFDKLSRYFKILKNYANNLNKPISSIYLKPQLMRFNYELEQEKIQLKSIQSESGIFENLLAYNPQIKIAGMSLSQALLKHQSIKDLRQFDKFSVDHILRQVLTINLQETYECVLIVEKMKQKQDQFNNMSQDEKIYFKEIMHQMLIKKSQIVMYLQLQLLTKRKNQKNSMIN